MRVVAIGGSPRLQGNTNYLIDQALYELASCGVETANPQSWSMLTNY